MATPVELPKLGNTVEECLIAGWRKRKGEAVAAGEIIADIETDKTTFELSAPVAGTLLETFFEPGALVPVFTNLCVIGQPGENVEAFRPVAAGILPAVEPGILPGGKALKSGNASENLKSNPGGKMPPSTAGRMPAATTPLSPRAARYAREHNVDLSSIAGSGPGGRILEADLRHAPVAAPPQAASRATVSSGTPLPGIRGKIAQRMRESLASTAQYTLNSSAAAGGLLHLRAKLKADKKTEGITINDLVAFCTIKALQEMPDLNAELANGKIVKHEAVHLGFACDTPRGLMVPVIRNAHQLHLAELARQIRELAARAVEGKIPADDLSGATFTISNLGNLGIESFTPVINPPQVAILGVGGIGVKTLRRQGVIAFVDSIHLSLTCDHQVIDGAPGARFLQLVSEKIEHVESLIKV